MGQSRVLSGIRATGRLHLGNLLGAVRQWTSDQAKDDCFYFIADLHSITEIDSSHDRSQFRFERLRTAASFLAAGLDPEQVTIFFQSAVPYHTELMWYLNAVARKGELERMIQWKDKAGVNQAGASAGLFAYPVLMAADILLYDSNEVPVGDDQRQHVEITREWAERFNSYFGPTFVVPRAVVSSEAARIMDLQRPDRKMSKSYASELGTIFVDDRPDEIRDKFRRAVTDADKLIAYQPEKPGISNLIEIFSVVSGSSPKQIAEDFDGETYGKFKNSVADAVISTLDPIRLRMDELMADSAELEHVLAAGAENAAKVAAATCERARSALGLI